METAQARWLKVIEVFNEQGESRQLKLFPSDIEPPEDDSEVARVQLNEVRFKRVRQFGTYFLGLEPGVSQENSLERHNSLMR